MTINITPDMLAGARKKASDRSSSIQSSATNPRPNIGPPPPTCPKKRKTICELEASVQKDKKKEESGEEPAPTSAVGVTRRHLLSLKEDEVVDGEDGEAARPKAPPRVRPKTRPKTMLHSTGASQKTETEPEWVTRANKKHAVVD